MMRLERGFALILVLWALILLTTIGMTFAFAVRIESASGAAITEQVRAEAIATAGVRRAILGLLAKDREVRWKMDGHVYDIPWPGANLRATIRAENGKIDVNYAQPALLKGLFELLLPDSDAEKLTAAVLDWRDRDDNPRPEGAEREEYEAEGRHGPANTRFSSIEELAQVAGFDGAMLERLRPHITVYGRSPRVNALAADTTVLASVPEISTEMAQQFVVDRDAKLLTDEAPNFELLGPSNRYLDKRPESSTARIRADAKLSSGTAATIEAVVDLKGRGKSYEILDWTLPLPTRPNPEAVAQE